MSGAGVKAVASPEHPDDPTFSLAVWYTNNAGLPTDSAPTNLGSVAAARILRATAKRGGLMTFGAAVLRAVVYDGTSLVVRPWFYDDTAGIWVPHGANQTLTTGSTNTMSVTVGNIAGAKLYLQVVTNTGTVKAVGYDIV